MIELLSNDDIAVIDQMRSRGTGMPVGAGNWLNTRDWLHYWDQAKSQYLNKIFKDELIISKKITYSISTQEIINKINRTVFNEYNNTQNRQYCVFKEKFKNAFRYIYEDRSIPNDVYWAVCSLMDSETLAENKFNWKGDQEIYNIPIPHQDKPFRLQYGAKASKAIGKLCQLMNIDGWEPLRLKISQILNDSKLSGMLHLSIHPMDYMSASVNENRWSSCMHFYDGEYRRGVIEMMNSPMVVVAYISSAHENIDINGEIWNSKKWREFFIVDPAVITGVKGYPYMNPDLDKIVTNWLRELVIANDVFPGVKWNEKQSVYSTSSKIYIEALDSSFEIPMYDCGPAMYNDFYGGNEYIGYFSDKCYKDCLDIFYSGFSECVICGGDNWDDYYDDDYASGLLNCYNCDPTVRCASCGDRYDASEMYELNGNFYCSYCYNELSICDICGERFDPESNGTINMMLAYKEEPNHEEPLILKDELCICGGCEDDILIHSDHLFDKYYNYGDGWGRNYYFTLSDLTANAKISLFGTDNDREIVKARFGDDFEFDEENNPDKEPVSA